MKNYLENFNDSCHMVDHLLSEHNGDEGVNKFANHVHPYVLVHVIHQ